MVTLLHSSGILRPSFTQSQAGDQKAMVLIELTKETCPRAFVSVTWHITCLVSLFCFLHAFESCSVGRTCADRLDPYVLSLTGLWQISLDMLVVFGCMKQGVPAECWAVLILGTRWQGIIFSNKLFSICVLL